MELIKEELSTIVIKIIEDGRKYNLIDRFFHYKIERENLYKKINSIKFSAENVKLNKDEFLTLYNEYLDEIDFKIRDLIETIKSSFGIDDFYSYKIEGKSKIINNPYLLGISPYLYDFNDFKKYLRHDILISKIGSSALDFHYIFESSLNDTLNRLNSNSFLFYNTDSVDDSDVILLYDSGDVINLFYGEIFSIWNNFETLHETIEKDEQKIDKIVLNGSNTGNNTGNIINILIGSFKGTKALNDLQKKEIKNFVSMIFVNKAGKRLKYQETLDLNFISTNIRHLTETLKSEKKFPDKGWSNKKLSELICSINPKRYKLKTIENY
jgi:hypothetical protein